MFLPRIVVLLSVLAFSLLPLFPAAASEARDARPLSLVAAEHGGHGSSHEKHKASETRKAPAAQEEPARVHTATGIFGSEEGGGRVSLTHDPIPALNWPKMTMYFVLETPATTEGLKKGDKVRFDFRKNPDGTLRILHIEPF